MSDERTIDPQQLDHIGYNTLTVASRREAEDIDVERIAQLKKELDNSYTMLRALDMDTYYEKGVAVVAFTDNGVNITSTDYSAETVEAMSKVAEINGWDQYSAEGSDEFKQAASNYATKEQEQQLDNDELDADSLYEVMVENAQAPEPQDTRAAPETSHYGANTLSKYPMTDNRPSDYQSQMERFERKLEIEQELKNDYIVEKHQVVTTYSDRKGSGFVFVDHGNDVISTNSESEEDINSILKLAEAKGWQYHEPNGSKVFTDTVDRYRIEATAARVAKYSNAELERTPEPQNTRAEPEKEVEPDTFINKIKNKLSGNKNEKKEPEKETKFNVLSDEQLPETDTEENKVINTSRERENTEPKKATESTQNSNKEYDQDIEQKTRARLAQQATSGYEVNGNRYMFRHNGNGNREAFRDRGNKLTTKHNDERITKSIIELARAKGWTSIRVAGTRQFRRQAWLVAQQHGLEVQGYKATELDQAAATNPRPSKTAAPDKQKNTKTKSARIDPDRFEGKLIEHGAAPYQNKETNSKSYFVTVENESGTHTRWGVKLGSALKESGAKVGDQIQANKLATKDVEVSRNGEKASFKRNEWQIVSAQQREKQKEIIKEVGSAVADRVPDASDAEAIKDIINEHIDSHQGAMPPVPMYEQQRTRQLTEEQEELSR